jgi:hypothetical protein
MKPSGYRFLSDREPTMAELNSVLTAATIGVNIRAVEATKKALKLQKIYYRKMKATYSKKILEYASKA